MNQLTKLNQIRLLETIARIDEQEVEVFGGEAEEDLQPGFSESNIEHVRIAQQYIQEISSATLDNDALDEEVLHRLRDTIEQKDDIYDPYIRLSLDIFIAFSHASEATYNSFYDGIRRRLSLWLITCASTHARLSQDRLKTIHHVQNVVKRVTIEGKRAKPRQKVCTIPLGPQIQALRRSRNGALVMLYRDRKTREILERFDRDPVYDDIFSGGEFLDFAERVQLGPYETTVTFSLDGAQLYQKKKSDTWIAVWIINNYDPTTRYNKKLILLPALVIPGTNKPKNIESFVYRSFHHLSALQHENDWKGLQVWDAYSKETVFTRVFFLFGTADAVGLTEIDGRVGHHGAQCCRMSCDMKGRHKQNSVHYCSAHLRPSRSLVEGSNHPDYNFREIPKQPSI
jgi:hypothetical protein